MIHFTTGCGCGIAGQVCPLYSVSCVSLCFLFTLSVYVFSCPVVMGLWRLLPAFLFFFYLLFIFTPAGIPVFASFYTLNSLVLSFYTFSLRFSFLFHTLLVYLFSCPVVMGLWCFELAPFAGIYFTCISILWNFAPQKWGFLFLKKLRCFEYLHTYQC